jgi:hypothetical protein
MSLNNANKRVSVSIEEGCVTVQDTFGAEGTLGGFEKYSIRKGGSKYFL